MNPGPVIHAGLLDALSAFLPTVCTILAATYTTSATGAKTASWAALAGHDNLPCRVGPVMAGVAEYQNLAHVDLTRAHRTVLLAYHPDILPGMRVEAGANTYTIQTVRHDGQGSTTELLGEEVSVP